MVSSLVMTSVHIQVNNIMQIMLIDLGLVSHTSSDVLKFKECLPVMQVILKVALLLVFTTHTQHYIMLCVASNMTAKAHIST